MPRRFVSVACALLAAAPSCKRETPRPAAIHAEGPIAVDALSADALAARIERAGFRILQRSPDGSIFSARHRGGRQAGVAPEITVLYLASGSAGLPAGDFAEAVGERASLRLRIEGNPNDVPMNALGEPLGEPHDAAAKRFLAALLAGTAAPATDPLPKPAPLPADFRVPLPKDHRVVRVFKNAIHVTSAESVDALQKFFARELQGFGCEKGPAPLPPAPESASGAPPLPRAALAWRGGSREVARIDLTAIDDDVTVIAVRARRGFEPPSPRTASGALPDPRSLPPLPTGARAGDVDERVRTLHACGRYREAAHACADAARRDPDNVLYRFNLACLLARAGDTAGALEALEQLRRCGTSECAKWLKLGESDEDLAALKNDPRFSALVAWARARAPK
jgi:hypothetical protein